MSPYVTDRVDAAASDIVAALEANTSALVAVEETLTDVEDLLAALVAALTGVLDVLTARLPEALAAGKLKVTIL